MRPNDEQSAALMCRLTDGDDAALNELIVLWQRPLLQFIYRYVQNHAEAGDLLQETFVRVYQSRSRFRQGSTFSTWAFTIAANLCRNRRRWHFRHPTESLDEPGRGLAAPLGELACPRKGPDGAAVQSERVEALKQALTTLSHDLRTTLLLYEYEGLSYREIGSVVGCSEKGVESRLSRARLRLRQMLAMHVEPSRRERAELAPQRG